ncbi:MAG: serine protease, partial [Desulfamplus sp.]|nr:serine protease [Desulfamplus sp.]
MKRNRNFKINNIFWITGVLAVFIAGAVWTNSELILKRSIGDAGTHESAMTNQGTGSAPPMVNNSMGGSSVNSPTSMMALPTPLYSSTTVSPGETHSPATALMMQEGISHLVSLIKPSVVGVSRTAAGQEMNQTYSGGLSYIPSYRDGTRLEGSGVIIDPRGYVLTTFQTTGSDTVVNVKLFSGKAQSYQADVIAVDQATD